MINTTNIYSVLLRYNIKVLFVIYIIINDKKLMAVFSWKRKQIFLHNKYRSIN